MTHAKTYPGATQKRNSAVSGGAQPRITKLVLHSTETSAKWGCPGYSSNRNAPTLTIDPWNFKVWQHFDANESAKALVDPGSTSVRENRDNVAQVEIIGYSDVNTAKQYGYNLRELPQSGIDFIAKVVRWYHEEWEVPLLTPSSWPMYPDSYGNSPARMSGTEYDAFEGVLGHLHVSGNSHGDPAIDIKAVMKAAGAGAFTAPPHADPAPKWDGKSFPGRDAFKLGKSHPAVTVMGQRLVVHGFGRHYKQGPGPTFSEVDRKNCAEFQRAQGYVGSGADGYPGPQTWAALMKAPKATPSKPRVSLSAVIKAAKLDTPRPQGGTTPGAADDVRIVEAALRKEGLLSAKYASDGSFGGSSVTAYAAWQRRCGYSGKGADGIPGKKSLSKLGAKYGFTVAG